MHYNDSCEAGNIHEFIENTYFKLIGFRIQLADPEYKQAFEDELVAFKDRIRTRAKQKIQEALEEEEAERQRELDEGKADRIKESPGGLDPIEVLESLPEDLRR